jgi:N-acetylglucosaminyldiphosphoundecaprenol N-acetyl-beta-D-mannosaminyltransferase
MAGFMTSPIAVPQSPDTASVLGLPLHRMGDYSGWLTQQLKDGRGVHVVTLNAEMAMLAEHNADLAAVIRGAELVIPDGAGVVLCLRVRGMPVQRCPGIELAEALLQHLGQGNTPQSVFFYGGAPGVSDAAAQAWRQRLPELAIAGIQHGYLSPDEQADLEKTLEQQQPALVLVGLGVPRQEFWIRDHRHLCPNSIWIGVGGSFDIWSGTKDRAPGWLRNNHLEWLYRLYQEPWRWKRMLALPKFAWKALRYADR